MSVSDVYRQKMGSRKKSLPEEGRERQRKSCFLNSVIFKMLPLFSQGPSPSASFQGTAPGEHAPKGAPEGCLSDV